MKKVVAGLRMIFICCFIAAYLVIVGIPLLTYCRLIRNPALGLRYTKLLDRMVLFLAGVTVLVEGREKVDPARGNVYVGNHRSLIDVCAVFLALPGDLRFLAKKELYKIPLVSFALRTMGIIEVDRSDSDAAAKSIDRAVSEIRAGRSVVLFPEGTRSRQPHLLPFKKGAFVLAIKAQAPVVPVTLLGMDQALRPDTILLYPSTVRLIIHDPIETTGMTLDDRNSLLERARTTIEETFEGRQNKAAV